MMRAQTKKPKLEPCGRGYIVCPLCGMKYVDKEMTAYETKDDEEAREVRKILEDTGHL